MKIKQIIFGILLFFIFYLEPIYIGPIKFAHLWKIPVLLYLLFSVKFKIKKDKITKFSFLYYIKYFLTTGIIYFGYLTDGFLMFVRGISIPIIFNYLKVKKFNTDRLISFLQFTSSFVILSAIPFLINLIQPFSSGYDLDIYGIEDMIGFVGIFQNPHGAAVIISQALLIKLFFIIRKKRFTLFNILIILIGFFALYKTYVRTGYAMFLIGAIIIYFNEYGLKRFYKLIPILLVFVLTVFYIFNNDESIRARIFQNYANSSSELTIDKFSSGRITLSLTNLSNYFESNLFTKIFGMGFRYSTDLMYDKIGVRKASHNGYVDAIVHNGLLGFVFYFLFLLSLLKTVLKNKESNFYSLGLASLVSFFLLLLFQGGNFFLLEVQLLIIVYISQKA